MGLEVEVNVSTDHVVNDEDRIQTAMTEPLRRWEPHPPNGNPHWKTLGEDNRSRGEWEVYTRPSTSTSSPPRTADLAFQQTQTAYWPWRPQGNMPPLELEKRPLPRPQDRFLRTAVPAPPETQRSHLRRVGGHQGGGGGGRTHHHHHPKKFKTSTSDAALTFQMQALTSRMQKLVNEHEKENALRLDPGAADPTAGLGPPASIEMADASDDADNKLPQPPSQPRVQKVPHLQLDELQESRAGVGGVGGGGWVGQGRNLKHLSKEESDTDTGALTLRSAPSTDEGGNPQLPLGALTTRGRLETGGGGGGVGAMIEAGPVGRRKTKATAALGPQTKSKVYDDDLIHTAWIKRLVTYTDTHPIHIPDEHREMRMVEGGKWERVVFPSLMPVRREDSQLLHQWMLEMLQEISMDHRPSNNRAQEFMRTHELSDSALWVYRVAFEELNRQVGVQCGERAALLKRIWEQFFSLVELKARLRYEDDIANMHEKLESTTQAMESLKAGLESKTETVQETTKTFEEELGREQERAKRLAQKMIQDQKTAEQSTAKMKESNAQLLAELTLRIKKEKALDEIRGKMFQVKRDLEETSLERNELRAKRKELEQQCDNLDGGLQLEIKRNHQLLRKMEEANTQTLSAREELASEQAHVVELMSQLSDRDSAIKDLKAELLALKQEAYDLRANLKEANQVVEKMEAAQREIEGKLSSKMQSKVAVDLMYSRTKKENEAIQRKMVILEKKELTLKEEFDRREEDLKQQLAQVREQLADSELHGQGLQATLDRVKVNEKEALDELASYLDLLKTLAVVTEDPRWEKENPDKEREWSAQESSEWSLRGRAGRGQRTILEATSKCRDMAAALEASVQARDVARRQTTASDEERRMVSLQLHERLREIEKMARENDKHRNFYEQAEKNMAQMEKERAAFEKEIKGLKDRYEKQKANNRRLENDVAMGKSSVERYDRLKAQVGEIKVKNDELEILVAQLKKDVLQARDQRDHLAVSNEDLAERATSLSYQVKDLSQHKEESLARIKELDMMVQRDGGQVAVLTHEVNSLQSQLEAVNSKLKVETARFENQVAQQRAALVGANLSVSVSKFFLNGIATDPRLPKDAPPANQSNGEVLGGAEVEGEEGEDAGTPGPENSDEWEEEERRVMDQIRRAQSGRLGRSLDSSKVEALREDYSKAKAMAKEAAEILAATEAQIKDQDDRAKDVGEGVIPTSIPWRENLAKVQRGMMSEAIQRLRLALREKETEKELLVDWAKGQLHSLAAEVVQEFELEKKTLDRERTKVQEMRSQVQKLKEESNEVWLVTADTLNKVKEERRLRMMKQSQACQVSGDANTELLKALVSSIPTSAPNSALMQNNSKDKCSRLVVQVYCKRLEKSITSYADSERISDDCLYEPMYLAFASLYAGSTPKHVEQKMFEFCYALKFHMTGQGGSEQLITFGRFLGVDSQATFTKQHFFYFFELLDCIRRLMGVNWRKVVTEWEKGSAEIPLQCIMDVVANVYNTNTPQTTEIATDYLLKMAKEGRLGPSMDLDTFLTLMMKELPNVPVYPLYQPRQVKLK